MSTNIIIGTLATCMAIVLFAIAIAGSGTDMSMLWSALAALAATGLLVFFVTSKRS